MTNVNQWQIFRKPKLRKQNYPKPMTKCLKKGAKIDINNPEYINSFQTCKNILSNEPLLMYPDFSLDKEKS